MKQVKVKVSMNMTAWRHPSLHRRATRMLSMAALVMLILLLGGCSQEYKFRGTPYDPVIPAPSISGVNLDNTPFALSELGERVKVVFFGYTFCPDVCPLTLANMKGVYDSLTEAERAATAFVFITVDPARDTPERLAAYVGAFNPAFYGVQVEDAELVRVKKDYGVYAEKRVLETSQSAADYLIDHTAFVYIIDKENNLREIFAHDAPKGDIAADIAYLAGR
jgi:protein SCO1/2